jgi:hypothetical protein
MDSCHWRPDLDFKRPSVASPHDQSSPGRAIFIADCWENRLRKGHVSNWVLHEAKTEEKKRHKGQGREDTFFIDPARDRFDRVLSSADIPFH